MAILACGAALYLLPWHALTCCGSLCLFDRIFGARCWGCGIARGVWLLVHGRVAHAHAKHPLSAVVVAIAVVSVVSDVVRCWRGRMSVDEQN